MMPMPTPQAGPDEMGMDPQQVKAMIRQGLSQMRKLAAEYGIDFDSLLLESSKERAQVPPPILPR